MDQRLSLIISECCESSKLARRVLYGLGMKTLAVVALGMLWTAAGCTDSGDGSDASDLDGKAPAGDVSVNQPAPASSQDSGSATPDASQDSSQDASQASSDDQVSTFEGDA